MTPPDTTPGANPTPAAAPAAPNFEFRSPGGFPLNFALAAAAGYPPSAAEQAYLDRIAPCIAKLADLSPPPNVKEDPDLLRQKEGVRDRAVKELRARAEAFAKLPAGAARDERARQELYETYRAEGRYKEWIARINTIPFTVTTLPDKAAICNDLKFDTRDVRIPEDKAKLKVEIDAALTVTKIVFTERESSVGWRDWLIGQYGRKVDAVRGRLAQYIRQLEGIATVGLQNVDDTQVGFARLDLARYKSEFTAREAGTVKNRYLWRLGGYCLLATVVLAVLYGLARESALGPIAHYFRNFFLLAVGTAIGTWLSFSLRRPSLGFDDLAVLEEDRLDPHLRVLFMIGLTAVIGLLFWTDAVSVGIGGLQSASALREHGAAALLVGLLGGIAERALSTAVSRRAADFAASLAGAAKKP
jgi:hypothetical protein